MTRRACRVLLLALLLTFPPAARGEPILWGTHMEGAEYGLPPFPLDMRSAARFESHARKRPSVLTFGNSWMNGGVWQPFPRQKFDNVRAYGAIPFYTWGPRDGTLGADQPTFRPAAIAAGRHDEYLRSFAIAARDWGHPFFLRFAWEANGWWYPWGEGRTASGTIVNGNRTGDYVAMWRHVREVFESVGATNVTWVWCVNHESTTTRYPPLSTIYPGGAVVDWTAMDPYNAYPPHWLTFAQTLTGAGTTWLTNTYQEVRDVAPGKPMMLAEYASWEDAAVPGRKAAWITDAHERQLVAAFPAIKAVLWFNRAYIADPAAMLIESSPSAQEAFASSIASARFTSNGYGATKESPILPPGPNTSVTLTPVADTYTDALSPRTAFGTAKALLGDGDPIRRVWLKFDLTGLQGRVLTSAELRLTTPADGWAGASAQQPVRLVPDSSWSERYMTFVNTTAASDTVLGAFGALPAGATSRAPLDLLHVQGKVGGRLSLALAPASADGFAVSSREGADPPRLVLTWNAAP